MKKKKKKRFSETLDVTQEIIFLYLFIQTNNDNTEVFQLLPIRQLIVIIRMVNNRKN